MAPTRHTPSTRPNATPVAIDATDQAANDGQPGDRPAASQPADATLESRVSDVGQRLGEAFVALLDAIPGRPRGPVAVAKTLGIDKVLSSRVMKAARVRDPIAVAHHFPGPDPLRRLIKAAGRQKVEAAILREAESAVDAFEQLIRHEAGDRGSLDAMISAWLPEVREQFEFRRKQAAFRAMSQLKGVAAETNLAAVFLHPAADATKLDVIWVFGLLGLQRVRPGAPVKFATRRIESDAALPRQPRTLGGEAVEDLAGLRLDAFCSEPVPQLDIHKIGEVMHYTLAGDAFGPESAVDLVFAEANFSEMHRYRRPGPPRKANVFAEIATPSKSLLFDVFVHEDVFPGATPDLCMYDTVLDGIADVNDPTRDIDRLDFIERVETLGRGTSACRLTELPRYVDLLRHVFSELGWDEQGFRTFRTRIDYPVYGSQVAMKFEPPEPPAPPEASDAQAEGSA